MPELVKLNRPRHRRLDRVLFGKGGEMTSTEVPITNGHGATIGRTWVYELQFREANNPEGLPRDERTLSYCPSVACPGICWTSETCSAVGYLLATRGEPYGNRRRLPWEPQPTQLGGQFRLL